MSDLLVTRTEPEGAALAVAWLRLRGAPSLWLPLLAAAAATAARVLAWTGIEPQLWGAALAAPMVVTFFAMIVGVTLRPLFREMSRAPGELRNPIRVRWPDAPPGGGSPFAEREAHLLPSALRIVVRVRTGRETLLLLLVVVLGGIAMNWLGPIAALALTWAFGFPRRARLAVEVPWEDVESVVCESAEQFRVQRTGGRSALVLQAKHGQAVRLRQHFHERLGHRLLEPSSQLKGAPQPAVLRPEPGDEDRGIAELLLRRGRWPVRAALFCILGAGAAAATGRLSGQIVFTIAAGVLATVGFLCVFAIRSRATLWRGHVPAPDDSLDAVPVRWSNRPGFPGPGPNQVHVLPGVLRVVGAEWEPWDVLVVVAAGLAAFPFGSFWYAVGAVALLNSVGIPRRRRVVVEMPWDSITRAEVRKGKFEIRSDLLAPADVVCVEAKFSARDHLTAALVGRLGDRMQVVSTTRAAPPPAA